MLQYYIESIFALRNFEIELSCVRQIMLVESTIRFIYANMSCNSVVIVDAAIKAAISVQISTILFSTTASLENSDLTALLALLALPILSSN